MSERRVVPGDEVELIRNDASVKAGTRGIVEAPPSEECDGDQDQWVYVRWFADDRVQYQPKFYYYFDDAKGFPWSQRQSQYMRIVTKKSEWDNELELQ